MATEKRLIAYDPITFEAFTRSIIKHRAPYDYYDDGYIDAVERIEEWLEQNTVDAVEVVRCKDCKHYMLWEDSDDKKTCAKSIGLMVSDPDDFCSYGEKREV